jgi:hypothetical protein
MEILSLLILDVFLDHLVCDGTGGNGKVAPRPEVSAVELLFEFREHLEELEGGFALELLHGIRDMEGYGV